MSDKIDELFGKWQENKDDLAITQELLNTLFATTGNWRRCEDIYLQLPEKVRTEPQVCARHIEFLVYHKQFELAIPEAEKLCAVTMDHHLSLHYLALTNFMAGKTAKVAELANKPKLLPETAVIVARALFQQGKEFNKAIELIKNADSAEGLGLLSLLLLDVGRFEEAVTTAKQALAKKPEQIDAMMTKASMLIIDRQYDAATKTIETVLSIKPKSGRAMAIRGQALFFNKRLGPAMKVLEQALSFVPDHVVSIHLLGWCYLIAGQFDVAAATFEKTLSLQPNFAESRGALAVIAAIQEDFDTAREWTQKVLTHNPECASARFAQDILAKHSGNAEDKPSAAQERRVFGDQVIEVVKHFYQG